MGSFTYTSINSSPWSVVTKQVLCSPKKKEKSEQRSYLVSKKRERERKGEMCNATYKTTMDLFSSITCSWPKRWTSRFLRDTRFDLAIQMLWISNILISTNSVTKQTLKKWSMNKIEWMNDLSKKSMSWVYLKKQKNHSKYYEAGLVIIFIDLFWRTICEHESVSHPESEVWKESSEIILMHTNICEP